MIQFSNGWASTESSKPRVRGSSSIDRRESPGFQGTIKEWIGDHPLASIAVAAMIGATLGWLIKRR